VDRWDPQDRPSCSTGAIDLEAAYISEPAPTPIELPPKSPERLAEIRALHEGIRQGDESGTLSWEEVAAELGLLSSAR
jgi:hypothetical protein